MRAVRVDRVRCLAICVEPGAEPWAREEVAIDLVEPVARGQTLLVHAGVALANLDQTHAALASVFSTWRRQTWWRPSIDWPF